LHTMRMHMFQFSIMCTFSLSPPPYHHLLHRPKAYWTFTPWT
jgi:hypothetical protein